MDRHEEEKRAAAEAAALEVQEGSSVGLGTGSTVEYFLRVLATRDVRIRCVATSPRTAREALGLGLGVEPFDTFDRLDVAVDGADQVGPDLWLVKGGGGAHAREKVVAAAADRFVVIVSSDKLVDALVPPVPLEVMRFGLASTLRRLSGVGPVRVREAGPTPDGNVLADFLGAVDDPASLSARLESIPGLVDHGLFERELVSEVLVGHADGAVDRLVGPRSRPGL